MPEWLQVVSTIVAGAFTVGTIARGVGIWVWTNTIKRDLKDIRDELARMSARIDEWDGSEIWGDVQVKVGTVEVDQRLLKQSVEFILGRMTALESNFNAMRERRRPNDYRKQ